MILQSMVQFGCGGPHTVCSVRKGAPQIDCFPPGCTRPPRPRLHEVVPGGAYTRVWHGGACRTLICGGLGVATLRGSWEPGVTLPHNFSAQADPTRGGPGGSGENGTLVIFALRKPTACAGGLPRGGLAHSVWSPPIGPTLDGFMTQGWRRSGIYSPGIQDGCSSHVEE